jgi:transposase-like protein
MIGKPYPEAFKLTAVRRVILGSYTVTNVASPLNI